jgi:signal transduction histidine kinase
MNWWNSISLRLNLTLGGLTVGALVGLSISLGIALERFFIQDTQSSLKRQATSLASRAAVEWNNQEELSQWAKTVSQTEQVQVLIFDTKQNTWVQSLGVPDSMAVDLPEALIPETLKGKIQEGRFWIPAYPKYPWWLYSTTPIRQRTGVQGNSPILGAVYVAVPLKRPKQFAQQVQGVVMGIAIATVGITAIAGFILSRSLIGPLHILYRQAQKLQAGDYDARSNLKGKDELAELGSLMDRMSAKLSETLKVLKNQENSRRELMANVSHDFRTPLANLRLNLEAVLDGFVEREQAEQYLHQGCREIDYLSRLVNQLLLLSRADVGQLQVQLQAVSAVAIAQECLSRMTLTAEQAGLTLKLSKVSNSPRVWVDPELTGQAILNLLDNAIKYAADGGIIFLQVLSVIQRKNQYYVPLAIKDEGRGMERETLQRATERSYRGNRSNFQNGLGLGLAIAKQICQLQGGSLHLHSAPNQGTIVILLLPVSRAGS